MAVEPDVAARRAVEPGEQAEQRRLAGSRRADDRDGIARIDREADVVEDGQRRLAARHDLGELRGAEQGLGHRRRSRLGRVRRGQPERRTGACRGAKERHPPPRRSNLDSTVPLASHPGKTLQSQPDSAMASPFSSSSRRRFVAVSSRSCGAGAFAVAHALAAARACRRCSSSAIRSPRPTASPPGTGWVDLLAARLAAQKFPYRVVNASITGDTTAGGRARLPALLATHKPAIVVIELGGNDGLRGGNLASARDNLSRDGRRRPARGREAAHRRHEGAAQLRRRVCPRVRCAVRGRRAGAQGAARAVLLRRASASATICSSPTASIPTAAAQPLLLDNVWPVLAAAAGVAAMIDPAARRHDHKVTVDAPRRLSASASTCAVRPSMPRTTCPAPRTIRCWTTPSARASARCTRRTSAFAARRAGAAIVARNIAAMLETSFAAKPRDWAPLVYCWRGGQRSRSLVHVLNEIGWRAVQLDGGYRAYRRQVVARLAELPGRFRYEVVCGLTGSGKSRLIAALAREGAQVLDLEAMARHRGSLLGDLPDRPAADAESVRQPARRRRSKRSIRRVRSTSSRRAGRSARCSFPTRCSPPCAAPSASASCCRGRCGSSC